MKLFSGRESCTIHAAQHSVHPTGGSLRVFEQFVWLGVDSVKMALSRPTHQRVTPTVSRTKPNSMSTFPRGNEKVALLHGFASSQCN